MSDRNIELRLLPYPAPAAAPGGHELDVRRAPWSQTARLNDGRMEVQLSGALPGDWSLRLTRGLARRGVGLRNGYARRVEPDAWLAQLELEAERAGFGADELMALATRPQHRPLLTEPRILDFELGDSPAHGGSLALEVHAWDAVGLLAGVLHRAAAAGLSATELILETVDDCAFHHLALQGRGWSPPTRRQRRALSSGLVGMLGGR